MPNPKTNSKTMTDFQFDPGQSTSIRERICVVVSKHTG